MRRQNSPPARQDTRQDAHQGTWRRFVADESGATAVEYGLMAALLGLAIMGTITSAGQAIKTELYDQIGNALSSMTK